MSQENVELIRRAVELLQRGEVQEFLDYADEIADPNFELRAVGRLPDEEPVRGRDAAKGCQRRAAPRATRGAAGRPSPRAAGSRRPSQPAG
jgi:hypothetical protein